MGGRGRFLFLPGQFHDMPQSAEQFAELWRVVRAMESALNGHLSGCGEQNRSRDRWEQDRREWERRSDANISAVCNEVRAMQRDRAREKGYQSAMMAVGVVLGSIASSVVAALLHKFLGV